MERIRMFFACDVHGSELVWRKFLGAAKFHNVDVLMMAGDLTGKGIVPLVERSDGTRTCTFRDKHYKLHGKEEIEKMCDMIRKHGLYPYLCTQSEVEELKADNRKIDALFDRLMVEGIKRWLNMIEQKVDEKVMVIVNPGNDDTFSIDEAIKSCDRVVYPLNTVIQVGDYEMISCEWTNPTPWDSPRECPEEELRKKIEREFDRVDSYKNLICNFHVPPYDTNLDVAPEVDENFNIKTGFLGAPKMIHVGSKAVREVFQEKQPALGLHGHIHESDGVDRIGETVCLNPGSEYTRGVLRAYVVSLVKNEIKYGKISSG